MNQIVGKSQEIPNFEFTNSVSDDSSVDTVDKCDQIGTVGQGISSTEYNEGQPKLFIVKTCQSDDNCHEDKTPMNIDAESSLKGDNFQISVDKSMNSYGKDLYINGQEHARSKCNFTHSENDFEAIPCLASGTAMIQ